MPVSPSSYLLYPHLETSLVLASTQALSLDQFFRVKFSANRILKILLFYEFVGFLDSIRIIDLRLDFLAIWISGVYTRGQTVINAAGRIICVFLWQYARTRS